ncbi:MAG: YraN family protein [Acidobacteriia bacterium]|nr:YraN family protein [Terriglobia bacterium]
MSSEASPIITLLYRLSDRLRRSSLAGDHGRIGEDLAHRYLRSRGCTVVARRYRPPAGGGEIDLVVWHGQTLVFVEVKTRSTAEFGAPERAVDEAKQEALTRAGYDYARRADVEWQKLRFDIVSIVLSRPPEIEWFQDAFRPQTKQARAPRFWR